MPGVMWRGRVGFGPGPAHRGSVCGLGRLVSTNYFSNARDSTGGEASTNLSVAIG